MYTIVIAKLFVRFSIFYILWLAYFVKYGLNLEGFYATMIVENTLINEMLVLKGENQTRK